MAAIAKRALVVARNAFNGSKMSSVLEQLGCSVDAASTGVDALKLMGMHCPYDLIVTELLLDGVSGLAVVILARKKNSAVKTIAINNGGEALRLFAMESSVDHVLELPLDAAKVFKAVDLILAQTTAEERFDNRSVDSAVWL